MEVLLIYFSILYACNIETCQSAEKYLKNPPLIDLKYGLVF